MFDTDRKAALRNVSIYLTVEEAQWLSKELEGLLKEPEALDHFHIYSLDSSGRELSCSLITKEKLKNIGKYTAIEQEVLNEK